MRKIFSFTVLGTVALSLVACSANLPTPQTPEGAKNAAPALTSASIGRVIEDLDAVVKKGDKVKKAEELSSRFEGTALAVRSAEYTTGQISPISTEQKLVTVTKSVSWPRMLFVVTTLPKGTQGLMLVQESPRERFKLNNWVTLFPKVTIPETAKPETGTPIVDVNSKEFSISPAELVKDYAGALNDPKKYKDPLLDSLRAETKQLVDSTKDDAKIATRLVPLDGTTAIGLHGGGALVFANYNFVTNMTVKKDTEVSFGGPLGKLLGGKVTDKATWTKTVMVMFVIPEKGKAEAVGAQATLVKAVRE